MTDKGDAVVTVRSQVATGDRQDAAGGSAGDGETEVEEMVKAEVPLVRKRRRLMKAGENLSDEGKCGYRGYGASKRSGRARGQ